MPGGLCSKASLVEVPKVKCVNNKNTTFPHSCKNFAKLDPSLLSYKEENKVAVGFMLQKRIVLIFAEIQRTTNADIMLLCVFYKSSKTVYFPNYSILILEVI